MVQKRILKCTAWASSPHHQLEDFSSDVPLLFEPWTGVGELFAESEDALARGIAAVRSEISRVIRENRSDWVVRFSSVHELDFGKPLNLDIALERSGVGYVFAATSKYQSVPIDPACRRLKSSDWLYGVGVNRPNVSPEFVRKVASGAEQTIVDKQS
jgi:hypothetical protein